MIEFFKVFNKARDVARIMLHRFSHFLGETFGVLPESLRDRREGIASLKIELPAFKSLLPYQSVDEDDLFINKKTVGFGLHVAPSAGADESLVTSLSELLKNKLPAGVDCTVMLYKHPYLEAPLSRSFSCILKKGGIYSELARMSIKYHLKALKKGYKNTRNVPAQLVDYRCYVFVSRPSTEGAQKSLTLLRDDWESELKVAGFGFERLEKPDFLSLMRTLVSPKLDEIAWPEVDISSKDMNEHVACDTSFYEVSDMNIDITTSNSMGESHTTRVINCEVSPNGWPKVPFALWQTPDLFANLINPSQGIPCPFLISMTMRGLSQEKTKALAKRRAKSLTDNSNAIQTFLNPSMVDEAREWHYVHEEGTKDNVALINTFYNVMLLTDSEHEREHVAKTLSAYRQMGFTLRQSRGTQWLRYLSSLPFFLSEGLFVSMGALGLTKKLSHHNAANLVPMVSDFKGSNQGLLVPTYRHQLAFLDPFDDKSLPITNFNSLTVASTGSGKTFFELGQILDGLSRGQQIFIIDLGASYKHLCELVGGTYIDASTIALNPFTLFNFDGVTEIDGKEVDDHIQIRNLLAIMANPNKALSEVQKAWLLKVTMTCKVSKGNKATMDDVLQGLRDLLTQPECEGDRRLKDLVFLLEQYGSDGLFGHMFNGNTPLLNSSNLVVLEMGELAKNPDLLRVVMFVMIVIIQGQFYHGDRRRQKRCNIDEAWRFLRGSNTIAAEFIEQGFRTARKYNAGFSVITQHLMDTSDSLQGRAIAASADKKIILRQGNFQDYVTKNPDAFSPLQQKMIQSFGEAKAQGFSSMMIQYGGVSTFHRYFTDPFSHILFSSAGEEFGEIEALIASGMSISDAVAEVARKVFGDELCE